MLKNLRNPVLLFSLAFLALAGWLHAADSAPQSVQVTVRSIWAGSKGDDFDPKLKGLEQQLKPLKHRSYRALKDETQTIPWQGSKAFEVPGGRSLTVATQEFQNDRIGLKIRLAQGDKPLIDTTVKIANKGSIILGGPAHEGGSLILSISAVAQ
jgi:hypothetical protein